MAVKFFAFALLAFITRIEARGSPDAPVLSKISDSTYDPVPQYIFGYDVQDALTGDSKSQIEQRNGNVVVGQYSLNDPDGTRRIVDYTSDSINGFNAIVRKAPLALATPIVANVPVVPQVEPVVAKAVAAPLKAESAVPAPAPVTSKSAPLKSVTPPAPVSSEAAAVAVKSAPPPALVKSAPLKADAPIKKSAALTAAPAAPAVAAPIVAAPLPVAYAAAPTLAFTRFSPLPILYGNFF